MFGAGLFGVLAFAGSTEGPPIVVDDGGAHLFRRDPLRRRTVAAHGSTRLVVSLRASGGAVGDSDEEALAVLLGAV